MKIRKALPWEKGKGIARLGFIGPGGNFEETVGKEDAGIVAGVVGGRGDGLGATSRMGEGNWEETGQRGSEVEGLGKGDLEEVGRCPGGHGFQGREQVAMETGKGGERVARQAEDRFAILGLAKPQGLARTLGDPVEYFFHPELFEDLGKEVLFAHGDAAAENKDVVHAEEVLDVGFEFGRIVRNVVEVGLAKVP